MGKPQHNHNRRKSKEKLTGRMAHTDGDSVHTSQRSPLKCVVKTGVNWPDQRTNKEAIVIYADSVLKFYFSSTLPIHFG